MHNKIGFRRRKKARHTGPLFVTVNKFETEEFPVRVRHFRLGQAKVLEIPLGASQSELGKASRAHWQGRAARLMRAMDRRILSGGPSLGGELSLQRPGKMGSESGLR